MEKPPISFYYVIAPIPCDHKTVGILMRPIDDSIPPSIFIGDGSFVIRFCLPGIIIEGTRGINHVGDKNSQIFFLPCNEKDVIRWRYIDRDQSGWWHYIVPYNPDVHTAIGNALISMDEKEFRAEYLGFREQFRNLC